MSEEIKAIELLKAAWPFILFVVSSIVWLIRLEAKVLQMQTEKDSLLRSLIDLKLQNKEEQDSIKKEFKKEIDNLKREHDNLEKDIWKKLNELNSQISGVDKTLSKMAGQLEAYFGSKH